MEIPFIEQLKALGWDHIEGDIDVAYLTGRRLQENNEKENSLNIQKILDRINVEIKALPELWYQVSFMTVLYFFFNEFNTWITIFSSFFVKETVLVWLFVFKTDPLSSRALVNASYICLSGNSRIV